MNLFAKLRQLAIAIVATRCPVIALARDRVQIFSQMLKALEYRALAILV